MAPSTRPLIIIVPGGAQTPAHYGQLTHDLMAAGYAVQSALLPSVCGLRSEITAQDDTDYIRAKMILPVLDGEQHDVILFLHSYSGLPGSAAAAGLSKPERAAAGKSTGVIGQIHLASVVTKGGDGKDLVATFGGQLPPHINVDEAERLIKCADPIPPLYHDVEPELAKAAVASCINQALGAYTTPCPRASWDEPGYKGRIAYIKTKNDRAVPYAVQDMLLQGSGEAWITRELDTSHSPNLSAPEKLSRLVLELGKLFEGL